MPTWFAEDPSEPFVPPPSRSSAHLTVLSEQLTADELAQLLGLPPDEAWERGGGPHRAGRFAGVSVRSRLASTAQPGDHLSDLLSRLEPVVERVQALRANARVGSVRLWVSHQIANSNPGISLSATQVDLLSQLHTGIELDIYVAEDPSVVR